MEIICPNCRRRFEARSRRIVCPHCSTSIDAWEVLIGQRSRAMASAASSDRRSLTDDSDFLEIPHFLVPEPSWPDSDLVLEDSYELRQPEPARKIEPVFVPQPEEPVLLAEADDEVQHTTASVSEVKDVDGEAQIETAQFVPAGVVEAEPVRAVELDVPVQPVETEREVAVQAVELQPEAPVQTAAMTEPLASSFQETGARSRGSRPTGILVALAAVAIGAIALYFLLGRSSDSSGDESGRNAAAVRLEDSPQPTVTATPIAQPGIAVSPLPSPKPSVTQTPVATPTPKPASDSDQSTDTASQTAPTTPTAPNVVAPVTPTDDAATTRARTVTGQETPGGVFTLQIAARSNEDEAKEIADRLIDKGYDARIVKTSGTGKMWYRVRVGMFSTREDAARYGEQLKQAGTVTEYFITDRRH